MNLLIPTMCYFILLTVKPPGVNSIIYTITKVIVLTNSASHNLKGRRLLNYLVQQPYDSTINRLGTKSKIKILYVIAVWDNVRLWAGYNLQTLSR
jgi:hypothetical protein